MSWLRTRPPSRRGMPAVPPLGPALAALTVLAACGACSERDGPSVFNPDGGVSAGVSQVVVEPKVDTLLARDSLQATDFGQLKATVLGFNGGVIGGARIEWSTSDSTIVTVDAAGVVRPRRIGTATVTATSGNKTDRATIVVAWATQRLTITSPTRPAGPAGVATLDTILVRNPVVAQDLRVLRARAIDARGDTLTGVRFTWSSSSPGVATVDSTGVVRARAVGSTVITAQGADLTATRTVLVASVVREVRVTAPASQALTDDTLRLTARALGPDGLPVADPRVAWASSDPQTATIDSLGLARFLRAGTVRFTATSHFTSASTGAAPSAPDVVVLPRAYLQVDAGLDHTCSVITLGRVYCWGRRAEGQLGTASQDTTCFDGVSTAVPCSFVPKRATTEQAFARVAAGDLTTCAIAVSGRAYCWGTGSAGQLGNGSTASAPTPTLVTSALTFDTTAGSLSVGGQHACAITAGTRVVYCWGSDSTGQLGTQTVRVSSTTPIPPDLPTLPVETNPARWVSAGARQTCAIGARGQAFCWGSNTSGALGIGSLQSRELPTLIASTLTFTSIAAPAVAGGHACALTTDGRALCWGANNAGQIGVDTAGGPLTTPQFVFGSARFSAIGVGRDFTCALGASDNEIYCWGANDLGQLGLEPAGPGTGHARPKIVNTPVALGTDGRVLDLPRVTFVGLSVGTRHACGLASDGTLYCWGSETFGPLGSPLQARIQPRPVRVVRPL